MQAKISATSAALVLVLAVASPASAAPRLKYTSKAFTVGVDQVKSAKAMCKGGRSVLGGGFDGGATPDDVAIANDSFPVDGKDRDKRRDDGWKVSLINTENVPAVSRVYATCGRVTTQTVRTRGKLTSGFTANVFDAECDGLVTGGGISVEGGDTAIISMAPFNKDSSNDDNGFRLEAWGQGIERISDASVGPRKVKAYAVCVRRGNIVPRLLDFEAADNSQTRATLGCGPRRKLTGAGAYVPVAPGFNGGISEIIPSATGVTGAVFADQGGGAQLTALCAKRLPRR